MWLLEILANTRTNNLDIGNSFQPLFSEHVAYKKIKRRVEGKSMFSHSFVVVLTLCLAGNMTFSQTSAMSHQSQSAWGLSQLT